MYARVPQAGKFGRVTAKEFADKLKEKSGIVHLFSVCNGHHYMVDIDDIDNILKETVGEEE